MSRSAPSRANAIATARPMPESPPVMTAFFPSRRPLPGSSARRDRAARPCPRFARDARCTRHVMSQDQFAPQDPTEQHAVPGSGDRTSDPASPRTRMVPPGSARGRPWRRCSDQARSNRSRFITLFHAATKSRTNFSFAVVAGVDLRDGAELRVRTEDEVDGGGGPLDLARGAVAALVHVLGRVGRLPLGAHVEQVDEEVVGQRLGPVGEDAVSAIARRWRSAPACRRPAPSSRARSASACRPAPAAGSPATASRRSRR